MRVTKAKRIRELAYISKKSSVGKPTYILLENRCTYYWKTGGAAGKTSGRWGARRHVTERQQHRCLVTLHHLVTIVASCAVLSDFDSGVADVDFDSGVADVDFDVRGWGGAGPKSGATVEPAATIWVSQVGLNNIVRHP